MKRSIIILIALLPTVVFAQQFPYLEGYNINPFILSPAYAGIYNPNMLFMDYRSDMTGFPGSPKTYQLSYNTKLSGSRTGDGNDYSGIIGKRVGLGGRLIYDKTDIFSQTLLMGTYSYEVKIAEDQKINFALSMGLYKNSIDFGKYFNDPKYVQDEALINGNVNSKVKFASDLSALYRNKQLEAGILFSNVMFGTVKYQNSELTYKPLKNYLLHAAYQIALDDKWSVRPAFVIRGGQNIPAQIEFFPTITWASRFWGTTIFRSGGIFGIGIGGEICDGIILNYSYSIASNQFLYAFGSHQLSVGIRILKKQK